MRQPFFVPPSILFSNRMLEDLDKIWALRHIIPDPTNPFFSNISCTQRPEKCQETSSGNPAVGRPARQNALQGFERPSHWEGEIHLLAEP